jgi:hypothetical protein
MGKRFRIPMMTTMTPDERRQGAIMHAEETARCEVLEELSLLFVVVQQLGRALENKSHGYLHHQARELNELLHQARRKLEQFKLEAPGLGQDIELPEAPSAPAYRPRAF